MLFSYLTFFLKYLGCLETSRNSPLTKSDVFSLLIHFSVLKTKFLDFLNYIVRQRHNHKFLVDPMLICFNHLGRFKNLNRTLNNRFFRCNFSNLLVTSQQNLNDLV